MTRKMTRVTAVHTMRCWKGTLVSGTWTSGMRGVNGLTKSRKRTVLVDRQHLFSINVAFNEAIDVLCPAGAACHDTYGRS